MLNEDVAIMNKLRGLYRSVSEGTIAPKYVAEQIATIIEVLELRQLPDTHRDKIVAAQRFISMR